VATNPKPAAPWGEYIPHLGRMTVEQFEVFPGEDGWEYELHEGRLIAMPAPGSKHARIQTRLYRLLDSYLLQHQLGELLGTCCFNLPLPGNTEELLCPDLSYVVPDRLAAMPQRGSYFVGAPDLAIEIASPSGRHPELAKKIAVYLQAGVRLVWAIWPPMRAVEVWRPASPSAPTAALHEGDMLGGLDVVPGFQCPVRALFEA
jgi:Uma2 family endonuclease